MVCVINQETIARTTTCHHIPQCPSAMAPDWDAARTMVAHPEQGWSLLCNGVVLFDDTGGLLPNGNIVGPRACRYEGARSGAVPNPCAGAAPPDLDPMTTRQHLPLT